MYIKKRFEILSLPSSGKLTNYYRKIESISSGDQKYLCQLKKDLIFLKVFYLTFKGYFRSINIFWEWAYEQ